jgi:membrane protein implicated in regulation of membrane protease activity
MKAILCQIALIVGGGVSALSLGVNLLGHMDLFTAVFRAILVFIATVTIIFLFLHIFSVILVRFVAEQVVQRRGNASDAGNSESQQGTFVRTRKGTVPKTSDSK